MGDVELPLVEAETTIDQAITAMVEAKRSGLVTERGAEHVVFTLDELVEELRERGDTTLSKLQPTTRTVAVAAIAPPKHLWAARGRPIIDAAMETLFRQHNADFSVVAPHGPVMMTVITAAESLAGAMYATPVLCACQVGHRYTRDQTTLRNGQCSKCTPTKPIRCG